MFKKKSYSDLEVQEIMETLFQEKKKVKELQLKLSNCNLTPETPSSSEEVKNLIIRLEKSKLAEQQSENKRRDLENELENLLRKGEQSERLLVELDFSKSQISKLQIQLEEQKEKLRTLETQQPIVDKQKEAQSERVIQFMRTQLEETQGENLTLLEKLTHLEKEKNQFQEACHLAERAQEELQEEDNALKAQMEQLRSQIIHLQNNDQTEALNQAHKELELAKQAQDKQEKAYEELAHFVDEMKTKLIQTEEEKNQSSQNLLKKEELNQNLTTQVATLTRSLEKVEEILRHQSAEKQENETDLRQAQQHLAKKMKEAALLAEQLEEIKGELTKQETFLQETKTHLAEIKLKYEAETLQKQNLQSQAAKWEEKFFQMQEKWQEVETRNRELKKLEERFGKLQNAFSHIGTIISTPAPLEAFDIPPPAKTFNEMEIVPKESLFEASPKPSRYKETLFG